MTQEEFNRLNPVIVGNEHLYNSKREAYLEMYANKIATYIFVETAKNTSTSNWITYFHEINDYYKVDLTQDKELKEAIEDCLYANFGQMILDLVVDNECFDLILGMNYCVDIVDDELEERGLEDEDL